MRIAPEQIHFLKFILEAYDGLAILSTLDRQAGLVELKYPRKLGDELEELLRSLAERIRLEPEFVDFPGEE